MEPIIYGIRPSELVGLAIFLFGCYLFYSIREKVVNKAFSADDYYIFWIFGLLFLCLHQILSVLDDIPRLELSSELRPFAFLFGSALFSYGVFKSYKKYKSAGDALK